MTLPIAHIFNGELGFDVRTKLNDLIDLAGGGSAPFTPGSVPFADASGFFIQDNANFFWDDPNNLLTSGVGLKIKGATSGIVTVNTKAAAGTWTLTLPDTAGISGYALTTNGSGVTSWIAPGGGGGGMAIGGAITGGTASRVLFTGAGGILDDDSTFTWNDTLKDLAIGGAYYVNAARALYVVPNATENNWFEGNAGNQTVSGYGNFGTGDLALSSLTSGYDNVGIGTNAGKYITSGSNNFAMGSNAMWFNQSDTQNVAIGYLAMASLGISGAGSGSNTGNIAIGYGAFSNAEQGIGNLVFGRIALNNVVAPATANFNVIVGSGAGASMGVSAGSGQVSSNTLLGANSAANLNGASSNNVWIGGYRGFSGSVVDSISISNGGGNLSNLDYHYTSAYFWSFTMAGNTVPACLHIYNMQNPIYTTTNYERAIVGWDINGTNVFRIGTAAGGSGTKRLVNIDAFAKAGAPAAGDLLAGCFSVIDDTSGGATWLVFNKAGTIRKSEIGGAGAIGGTITSATAGSVLFAGASGVLAQDNANLFWDDPNNILTIGNGLNFGSARAFYKIPNGSGDNWFAGAAGNLSVSGASNFAFGPSAMSLLTTGNYNSAAGVFAMERITSGSFNFAYGISAARNLTTGSSNVALGGFALSTSTTGSNNMAIGDNTLASLTGADGRNVAVGSQAGFNLAGAGAVELNTLIGYLAYGNATSGAYNTIIGQFAGRNITSGVNNTLIGSWRGPSAAMSHVIALSEGDWGSGSVTPKADFGYSNSGWTFVGATKAGAPAASDLSSGSFSVIDDTSAGQTWLVFNKAGTIRKVQLT